MAIIKCKMCGGDLNITEGMTVCECEYCGSKQTIPNADNEKKMTLFTRAGRLLRNCEFDKAATVFESIVAEFPEEAEAYWGNLLCKYGIEYVDDPATGRKVPTCHRSSFDSLMDDPDFELVMEYADPIAKKVYREQAKEIEEIRKAIVEVSGKEPPYDIFICYKETAPDGQRTLDSVLAQDIYDELTKKGYRVFFSRISLEDKLGTEYEPYIFAALNSAKVMLAFGTDYDYYDAVWVKNEWSRFLKLMAKDKEKHLIPCYKNIDAYDMPKEFAKLQAQDLGKVGATQDLLRGIEKILGKKDNTDTASQSQGMNQTVVQQVIQGGTTAIIQIKRGNLALEDREWQKADAFFEEALNLDPECAEAYLGKLMAELQAGKPEDLGNLQKPFDSQGNYQKVLRYGNDSLKRQLEDYLQIIRKRIADVKALEEEKAQEALIKEEELKAEAKELLDQLIILSNNNGKRITTSELLEQTKKEKQSAIDEAEKQIASLEELREKLPEILAEINRLREKENGITEQRNQLENSLRADEKELSSLGLFSGGKKKELNAKIVKTKEDRIRLNTELTNIQNEVKQLSNQLDNLNSIDAIQRKAAELRENLKEQINLYDRKIRQLETKLEEEGSSGKKALSLEEIVAILQRRPELKELFGIKEFIKLTPKICEALKLKPVFGRYPQTGSGKDQTPIEWQVLEVRDGKALLISEKDLDSKPYNTGYENVTWETCTLRKWLNAEFLNKAFSTEEQKRIFKTKVTAEKNPEYDTDPGNATTDQVFLLSISEANRYFTTDQERQCAPTAYAKAQGATTRDNWKTAGGEAACCWWLRSPGDYQSNAARVYALGGSISSNGYGVGYGGICVRPALWISLE